MCFCSTFGQKQQIIDSLKREATVMVYNNPELAIEKALEMYEYAEGNVSGQVSALLVIANGYAVLKEHDQVFKYALKADSIAATHKNFTDQIRVLGFIGGQYRRLKLSDKALHYLDKAYNVSLRHPLPDSLEYLQGNILVVKGLIQKDDLGCTYALPYLKEAVSVFKKNIVNTTINANLAITLNNIGDCNVEIKNFNEAEASYKEAILYATKIDAIKSIAASRVGLAKILSERGNYLEAIALLEDALALIKNVNDTATHIQILKALSENYNAVGNNEKYQIYTQQYLEEENKLLEEEKKSLNKVTEDLSSDNQEKRENQNNTYFYVTFISGTLLLLILVFVLYKIVQKRRKIAKSREKIQQSSKKE
tara:strand:- start:86001 stop:87098 length:1098 start_codon:yes stop_codon:yes gene_type:complete